MARIVGWTKKRVRVILFLEGLVSAYLEIIDGPTYRTSVQSVVWRHYFDCNFWVECGLCGEGRASRGICSFRCDWLTVGDAYWRRPSYYVIIMIIKIIITIICVETSSFQ